MRREIEPAVSTGAGLRRLAGGLMKQTLAQLEDPRRPPPEAVHDARKVIRLRISAYRRQAEPAWCRRSPPETS